MKTIFNNLHFILLLLILTVEDVQSQITDFYAKESFIDVDRIPKSVQDKIWYGVGVDMTNPFSPLPSQESPFHVKPSDEFGTIKKTPERVKIGRTAQNFSFRQAHTITNEELENFFSTELDASAIFVSLEARIQQAKKYLTSNENLYIILENYITNADVNDFNTNWKIAPSTESDNSGSATFLWNIFKGKYGSHYIQTVTFGYRIELLAGLSTTDVGSKESISVALNSFFADGKLSAESSRLLRQSTSNIIVKVTCGKLTNESGQEIPPIVMSISDGIDLFKKIQEGKIFVTACPLSFKAKSYLPTLYPAYPKTLSLFNVSQENIDNAIPPGTITAWYPIGPLPNGWSICDGNNGTPNLIDRFILGSSNGTVGQTGGNFDHTHDNGKTGPPLQIGGTGKNEFHNVDADSDVLVTGTQHLHSISSATNTPPFMKLVYIMKR